MKTSPALLLACLMLTGCPKRVEAPRGPARAIPLLAETAERETSQLEARREDVEIDTRDFERHPRVVATGETPLLELSGARARLYGDEGGKAGWSVDNLILLEVLAADGRVLSRAAVGFSEGVLIGTERVDNLGRMSFTFEPGEIDLTRILPEDAPFKLKATALDYSGIGKVSAVFLRLEHPAVEVDELRGN